MTTDTSRRLCDVHFVNTIQVLEELVENVFSRYEFTAASISLPIASSSARRGRVEQFSGTEDLLEVA